MTNNARTVSGFVRVKREGREVRMSSYDEEALRKGTVPWSAEECAEVMEWYHGVVTTPKDDWDLKERGFLL